MCLDSTILESNTKQEHTQNVYSDFISYCLGKELNCHAVTTSDHTRASAREEYYKKIDDLSAFTPWRTLRIRNRLQRKLRILFGELLFYLYTHHEPKRSQIKLKSTLIWKSWTEDSRVAAKKKRNLQIESGDRKLKRLNRYGY